MDVLKITNGEMLNRSFCQTRGGVNLPFNEMMMHGQTVLEIYSKEFINVRVDSLQTTVTEYQRKMEVLDRLLQTNEFSELNLWFGEDTFCQMNLLTLLAFLEQIDYRGKITLQLIDDYTWQVVRGDIPVSLGGYEKLYAEILVRRNKVKAQGVILQRAVDLFFDYHSADGVLARIIKENPDKEERTLLIELMEKSKEYGLSDTQARYLIEKYRGERC